MGRKALTKKQKVLNLLSSGKAVAWTTLRNKFDLTSPRAMVDQLRTEGQKKNEQQKRQRKKNPQQKQKN